MRNRVKLSVLRDIGFSKWDPIGLLAIGETWDHQAFADEYDTYLREAVSRLRDDWDVSEATTYLVNIEQRGMGLSSSPTAHARAEATATALKAYVDREATED